MKTQTGSPKSTVRILLFCCLMVTLMNNAFTQSQAQGVDEKKEMDERVKNTLKESAQTIQFLENKGQIANKDVLYYFQNGNRSVYIEHDRIRFVALKDTLVAEEEEEEEEEEMYDVEIEHTDEEKTRLIQGSHTFSLYLSGSIPNPHIILGESFDTKYNYFLGEDPNGWVSGVRASKELTLEDIYPGIDLRLYSNSDGSMEFDWVMDAGADYNKIKMRFEGQNDISVDQEGKLNVGLQFTDVKFNIPESYQVTDQGKVPMNFSFTKSNENTIEFTTTSVLDVRFPTVIDPTLSWGSFFDGNNTGFDDYLFAVQVDPLTGILYCAGGTNRQIPTGAAPYDANGYLNVVGGLNGGADALPHVAVIYRINSSGNDILDLTHYGPSTVVASDNTLAHGLSLSTNNVFISGVTTSTLPNPGSPFDGSRSSGDGFVAIFSKDLGTLIYGTYLGGSGNEVLGVTSIRALSDNSFVAGLTANAALPGAYISGSAPDGTFGTGTEMYIAKFTANNVLSWGTYVGGTDAEVFNDLEVFGDGRVAFAGYGTGQLTEVNSAASRSTGTGNTDGIVGVINTTGTAFNYLDEIGGSANDRINDVELVGEILYWTGSAETGFPVTGSGVFDSGHNGGTDVIIGKVNAAGSAGYLSTYYGTGSGDLGNGIRLITSTSCAGVTTTFLMVFGTVGGTGLPVPNFNLEPFHNPTYQGGLDMFFAGISSDLLTLNYGTYMGGSNDDYLGSTGDPRGANHLWVNNVNVYLGTTTHNSTHLPTLVAGGFDLNRSNAASGEDTHILISIQFPSFIESDYSDAPVTYGTPSHTLDCTHLKIGTLLDAEAAGAPTSLANGDDTAGSDDEDGISTLPSFSDGGPQNISVTINNISNTTGSTANLYGWIDLNSNGQFELSEFTSTTVANGFAGSKVLTWTGVTVSGAAANHYLRIRLTTNTLNDNAGTGAVDERSTTSASNGEVEDYRAIDLTCPANKTVSCMTQAQVDADYAAWLATVKAGGGCNEGATTNNSTGAPNFCGGTKTVTFTYTSQCAPLTTTCMATYTVTNNTSPTITTCAVARTIDGCNTGAITNPVFSATTVASTEAIFEGAPNNGNTSDACGITGVTYKDVATGSCPIVVTRTWTISDACGSSATCNQTITVRDITSPVISACAVARTIDGCNTGAITNPVFSSTPVASSETIFETTPNNGSTSDNCSAVSVSYFDVASGSCPIVVTRRWTVSDACGNTATCNQTITVRDITSPVISACAVARTIDGCNTGAITNPAFSTVTVASTEAVFESAPNNGNTSDNCSGTVNVNYIDVASGSCPIVVTRRWTVSDACGNTATCNQIITVRDITPPVNTGGTIAACYPTVAAAQAAALAATTATDNCSAVTETVSTVGTCNAVVTVTETDACGNSSSRVYNTSIDNAGPSIVTCAVARTIDGCNTGAITNPVFSSTTTASTEAIFEGAPNNGNTSDNCAISSVTYSDIATGTCPIVVTRRWTVSDVCGNTSTCNQMITVRDITSPLISACAVARTIDGCNTGAITNPAFSAVTVASTETVFESSPNNGNASDNCSSPVNVNYIDVASGTCPIVVTRRWTISDACGNTATCNQIITVRDITPPLITPGTIATCYPTVAAAQAAAMAATTATDNCSAVTETAATVGTCNAVVTVTETDACGNASSTIYNTSIDNAGPSIVACAVARTIDGCNTGAITNPVFSSTTTASTEAIFEGAPNNGNTSDNCAISSITYSDIATGTCPIVVTRRWTVSDVCGNTSTCNQTITVRDITPPVVTPGTIAACYQTLAAAEAAALAATTATDNCSAVTETVNTVGTCNAVVTVTETDACGNAATAVYNTRIDNTPPGIISGTIATCYATVAAAEAAALAATSATDNCSGTITETVSTVGTCSATVTVTETDGCGNFSTKIYSTSIDAIVPTIITCAVPRTLDGCNTSVITGPVFSSTTQASTEAVFENATNSGNTTDNCGIAGVTYSDIASGSCPIVVTRRWTISDACGNTSTCNQTITVRDITPPVCQTQNITVSVNPLTGLASITAAQVNNGSMDACSSITLSVNPSSFSCSNTGPNIVVLTVTDACLNSSTCTATVTITGCADLSLTKTVSFNSMTNVASFTITVLNSGPSPATGIEATDQLPNGYTYVSNTPSQGSYNNISGVWLVGNLGVGVSATLILNATVNPGIGLNYLNKAQITEDQQYDPDSDPETNDTVDDLNDGMTDDDEASATLSTADLSLTKTAGIYNSLTNQVVFTITVLNSGPTTATNVKVTDQLPNAYAYVSSSPSQGTYNNISGIWDIGTMPNGASVTMTITATVNTGIGLVFTNAAEITDSDQLDPDSNPDTGPTVDENGDGNGDDDDEDNATPVIADLSLTKTAGIYNSLTNQLVFTITVLNSGPNGATNVKVTDQLPNGYTYVSNTASQGSYSNVSGVWTIGSMANGASVTLTITAIVKTGTGLIYTNAAQITDSDQIDPDSSPDTGPTVDEDGDGAGDDDDEENATPILADLSLTKTVGIYNSLTNQLVFTITVLNSGPNGATNVKVTDQLPNAYTYVSNVPSQGSYNNVSGIWDIGSMANGASVTLTITATVNTGTGLIFTNAAQVTDSDQIDPDSSPDTGPTVDENGDGNGDDDDEDNATPVLADLSLTKTAGIYNSATNQLVFTITVLNSGPNGATNVKVTDQLPNGYTYVSNVPSQGSYNNVSGIWDIGSMANGASVTLTITVTVNTGIGLVYSNAAQITDSDQIDPDSSPDTGPTVDENGDGNGDDDDEDNATPVLADLSLTKTAGIYNSLTNQLVFTITVLNSGPNGATNVKVTDQLPNGYTFVTSSASQGTYSNVSGLWNIGSMANGASVTLTITVTVKTGMGLVYTNAAEVTDSDQIDPDSSPDTGPTVDENGDGNGDDDDEENAKPVIADLSLTKTAGTYNATLNQLVFTITVLNSGPDGATNVKVTDQLPTGYTYLSSSPSQGTYSNVSGLWNIGSMANGASVTLTITVKLNAGIGLVYINAAQVTDSDQIDPDSSPDTGPTVDEDGDGNGDDDDEENVTLQVADLSLTKTVNDNTPDQNSNIIYTITVFNSGPNNATGVIVRDILPAGVVYVSNTPSAGTYNNMTGLWTVGSLAVGASHTLMVEVTVTGSGVIINNTEITNADQADPDSDPNSSFNQDDHGDGVADDDEANVPITVNCGNCNVINGPTGPVCPGTTSIFNAQIVGLCQNPVYHWTVTGNFLSFVPNGSSVTVIAGNICGQSYTVNVSIDCQSCGTSPIVCMTNVLVQDAVPPVIITCAVPRTIEGCNTSAITDPPYSTTVAASSEAVFEGEVNLGNTTDGCGIASVTYFDVATGSCPLVVTRRWTISDACGNSATCNQTITVDDTSAPVISACAVTRTIEGCNTGVITNPPFSTVTVIVPESVFENAPNNGNVSDNCGIAFVSYSDIATGTCPIVVTRRWTVSDACGNTSTCHQTINVNDTTPPVFTSCPGNSTINCPATPVFGTPVAMDNCDPSVLITPVDVNIPGTCPGRYTVVRTWTAMDDCGNTATCSSTITVQDNAAPQINCPEDLVLNCVAGTNYVALINAWIATATATDACDGNVSISTDYDGMSIPNFSCQGGLLITFTATDDCGNTATCTATITKPCFTIESWVYLEGAAANPAGGASYTLPMRTTLNDLRVLPGQVLVDPFFGNKYSPPGQPYTIAPWNYPGNEGNLFDSGGNPLNSSAGYPATVVDWILVSLRLDSAGTAGPVCQSAAFVHKDGTIQFVKPLNCCGVNETTNYYLVIEHRNHLIVMSPMKVSFINHKLMYDFRFEQSWEDPLFAGLNLFAREKEILPGKFAMFAGNGNQTPSLNADTDINFDDRSFWESQNGAVGFYRIGDYNLNADTNFNDRIVWERNNGKFTSVPRN